MDHQDQKIDINRLFDLWILIIRLL